jgi:GntR family transcriptional repressor for pyruvate dehydrogenase complex
MASPNLHFEPIKRSNVTDMAMERLLELIRAGVLKPGDRLPSQRQLVSRMGVSQTALREALRGLASTGVIEVHAGRGSFVRSISPEMLVNPESLSFLLQRETLLQALEVRKILEVEAIALAAERATSEDLASMDRILRQIKEGVSLPEEPFRFSPYLHVAISKAAHNEVLTGLVKSFVRLLVSGARVIAERIPERRAREYPDHAALYEAILDRNPGRAREAMKAHLEEATQLVLQTYEEVTATPEQERMRAV